MHKLVVLLAVCQLAQFPLLGVLFVVHVDVARRAEWHERKTAHQWSDLDGRERQLRGYVVRSASWAPKGAVVAPTVPPAGGLGWQLNEQTLEWEKVWFGVDRSKLRPSGDAAPK